MKGGIETKLTMLSGILDLMTCCDDSTELDTLRNVALTALVVVAEINDEYCRAHCGDKRNKAKRTAA
ncbi:hypothetical protein [Pectobacterium sp. IFB5596]|uniref:hypothetical protein n=1 Tax=Pectobacterium sp. IFB5596 TaxID=1839803 RepID=UPI001F21837B|nr:hypothetical protein [Pectobacterium sp. IFB5596]MCE9731320.1 hypothetical protein [Pectobacterium sp. IFB5596]GKW11277.1 hypothetical protein PEC301899_15590 [Pectobacterium carotovorum subsp. carotovorum]